LDRTDDGPGALAVLRPLNLALRPQQLSAQDLDQLLDLLAVADLPSKDLPRQDPAAPVLIVEEPSLADLGRQLVNQTPLHMVTAHKPPEPETHAPETPKPETAGPQTAGPETSAGILRVEVDATDAIQPTS
jgi:hypothetical protein